MILLSCSEIEYKISQILSEVIQKIRSLLKYEAQKKIVIITKPNLWWGKHKAFITSSIQPLELIILDHYEAALGAPVFCCLFFTSQL